MKAVLVAILISANQVVELPPITVPSFQECLDRMSFAIRQPIPIPLLGAGVTDITYECIPAKKAITHTISGEREA